MEEIIALVLQLVVEVGLQLFGSLGIDLTTSRRKSEKDEAGCGWFVAFAVVGGICGGLSLLIRPNLILPTLGLRIANLIVAPLLAGTCSWLITRFVWTTSGWEPHHHFWRGFWFALLFGLVRFAYATHR